MPKIRASKVKSSTSEKAAGGKENYLPTLPKVKGARWSTPEMVRFLTEKIGVYKSYHPRSNGIEVIVPEFFEKFGHKIFDFDPKLPLDQLNELQAANVLTYRSVRLISYSI
jgi:hypothetical protein